MSILFKPTGSLDIATDPSALSEDVQGLNLISSAMQRCKNLRLDQDGILKTRNGYTNVGRSGVSQLLQYIFNGYSAIEYNAYNSIRENVFALNGTNRYRIYGSTAHNWGIEAPASAPTASNAGGTGLTGSYSAKITYCRKEGDTVVCESNPSPASDSVTLTNDEFGLTWTASSDEQVTHVRIYRTVAGGSTYYHQKDVAIGTTSNESHKADSALGSEVAINHDRPPLGSFVFGPNYNGYCFIIYNNLLYYCLPKQPEYWPATYFIEVSPIQRSLQCGVFYNGQPYVLSKNEIYHIQGTGHYTFFPFAMKAITGAQGSMGVCAVHGQGIFHTGTDGVYLFNGQSDRNITQANFQPIFRGESVNGVSGVSDIESSILFQYNNCLYFVYDSQYGLVFNLDNNRVSFYDWGSGIDILALDRDNNRLYGGGTSGNLKRLEVIDTNDAGSNISWEVESKNFTLQTRRHFPRWVKYDVDASDDDCSATGKIVLDGSVLQSHALNEDRNTRRRLIKPGNGKRCSIRLEGSGPIEIYTVESE